MKSIKDDRGFNQVWADTLSTRYRAERRSEYMLSKMDIMSSGRILEIGCGKGENAYFIAKKTGMKILATDICIPFIEEAKKNLILPNLDFDILDFNKVEQFEGERFDYVIGNGILHHLYYHLDEALRNIYKLLAIGGKIVFLEPNIYNPYIAIIFNLARKQAHLEPDEMAFSKSFIINKLDKIGFKQIEVEFKDFLLPGIPNIMIKPSVLAGKFLEKTPIIKMLSQSIFISAEK